MIAKTRKRHPFRTSIKGERSVTKPGAPTTRSTTMKSKKAQSAKLAKPVNRKSTTKSSTIEKVKEVVTKKDDIAPTQNVPRLKKRKRRGSKKEDTSEESFTISNMEVIIDTSETRGTLTEHASDLSELPEEFEIDMSDLITIVEVKEEEKADDQDEMKEGNEDVPSVLRSKTKLANLISCKYCSRTFRHKKNIRPHINKKHPEKVMILLPDTSTYFPCEYCERKFKYKKNLNAHSRLKHPECFACTRDEEKFFKCHICDRWLKYKRNLTAHIRSKHLEDSDEPTLGCYTCATCDRRFIHRKNLLTHLRYKHPSQIDQLPEHPCGLCEETFKTLNARRKHRNSMHPHPGQALAFPKKCPLCDFSTSRKLPILNHFTEVHHIDVSTVNMEFEDMQAFFEWKTSVEDETNCKYLKISTGKFEDHNTNIYQCHRSGRVRSKNKTSIDTVQSIKMNAYCPAQLYVIESHMGVRVRYTSTHVGHKNDLPKRAKPRHQLRLLRNIENVPEAISNPDIDDTSSYKELKRIFIKVCNKFKKDENTPTSQITNVDDWVRMRKQNVLFYKRAADPSPHDLALGDFVLVIMNKEQQSMMRKHGSKFVCVHTVCDSLKYSFLWTTIMVLGDQGEPNAVAFMMSNRATAAIYQVFFKFVAKAIGPIQPDVFMGDKHTEMYMAWTEVMWPAEQLLFCPWQVLADWRTNVYRITNVVRRNSVLELLENVLVETKYEIFEDELNSFLECSDPDVQSFRNYFIENYMETIPSWAFCYRVNTSIEGKLCSDDFTKIFESEESWMEKLRVMSMRDGLLALDQYEASKKSRIAALTIVGIDSLISIVENNHKRALSAGFDVQKVDSVENEWLVMLPATAAIEQVFSVRRNTTVPCNNCKLICPSCDVCFHRFSCSCTDCKKLTMCDHAHFVCHTLRNKELM